jgi:hypothetical protein
MDNWNERGEALLVEGDPFVLKGVQWDHDEGVFVFAYGPPEWGRDLYLHDVVQGTTAFIHPGLVYPVFLHLSPANTHLAVFDPGFNAGIIDLPSRGMTVIQSPYVLMTWSFDGRRLYGMVVLWDGMDYADEVRMIDLDARLECTVFTDEDLATIHSAGVAPFLFDVNPDQTMAAFWDSQGTVALVPLPQNLNALECSHLPDERPPT